MRRFTHYLLAFLSLSFFWISQTAQAAGVEKLSKGLGGAPADGDSFQNDISENGRFVCFTSYASNLVAGDTNNRRDVFLWDNVSRTLSRVSTTQGGIEGNFSSFDCRLSSDGRFISFLTSSTNIVSGGNGFPQVVLVDQRTGVRQLISAGLSGFGANGGDALLGGVSGDGKYVVWAAEAYDQMDPTAPGGSGLLVRQLYVKNRRTGAIRLISRALNGDLGDGNTYEIWFGASAKHVFFRSRATNLVTPHVPNGGFYRYDFETGRISLVAKSDVDDIEPTPNDRALFLGRATKILRASILGRNAGTVLRPGTSQLEGASRSGRYLAFISLDNLLVPGSAAPPAGQLIVRDIQKNRSLLISRTAAGAFADDEVVSASLSGSGRTAVFTSLAQNLTNDPDQAGTQDVFIASVNVPSDL